MSVCHIALGSNLGDPRAQLDAAIRNLSALPELEVTGVSNYLETTPAGGPPGQPNFLNAAAELSTDLDPFELLRQLQQIEQQLGRRRGTQWEARTIDLDLLLYEDRTIDDPQLHIPHPRMPFRRFVLEPLCEIAPDLRHPTMGWTIRELFENLLRRPLYLALAGPPACNKTTLARRIAQASGAELICQPLDIPRNDISRHDAQFRIQYLKTCAEGLNSLAGGEARGWLVSDYWLDQVYLTQRRRTSKPQLEQLRRAWDELQAEKLCPTLVACLDVPTATLIERCRERGTDADHFISEPWIDQARADLFGYLDQEQPAPYMRIEGEDLDTAQREILGTMQAAAG